MPHDSSRRDFLKKATYVPPILLSFHAAPSFARPGSVAVGPSQPGIQTLKPGVQVMNPTRASSLEPTAAGPRSAGSGARGGSSSGLDVPEFGKAASNGATDACEPVEDRRYGLTGSDSAAHREGVSRAPKVSVGSCSEEAVARIRGDALRALSSKLWKAGG